MPELETILLTDASRLEAAGRMAAPLLAWFDENARSMPWRQDPKPYHVWLSEIMLQQTRVEAARGYYDRFLKALPTVRDLADAPEEQLLKLWEGLGYYNRVRNLQKAARVICERHGGALPASYGELLELPGIGEYTAGAIASVVFGIPVPAVDGNVYRVIARMLGSYADTSQGKVKQAVRALCWSLIPEERPGDFNQALMELGATVCLPNGAPLCGGCPVGGLCASRGLPQALELPVKGEKKARRVEERTVIFLTAGGKVLLFRREDKGLLPGLYEPVNLEGHVSKQEAVQKAKGLGFPAEKATTLREAKHIFSHVEWRMKGYLIRTRPGECPGGVWAGRTELAERYPLPSAFGAYTKDLPLWLEEEENG